MPERQRGAHAGGSATHAETTHVDVEVVMMRRVVLRSQRDVEHLAGRIAAALMAKAPELLATPPSIEHVDIIAAKG